MPMVDEKGFHACSDYRGGMSEIFVVLVVVEGICVLSFPEMIAFAESVIVCDSYSTSRPSAASKSRMRTC